MYGLIFLICTADGCMSQANPTVFYDPDTCHAVGVETSLRSREMAISGEAPPHNIAFQCVSWGEQT